MSNAILTNDTDRWELRIIGYDQPIYLKDFKDFDELDQYLSANVIPTWIVSAFYHVPSIFYYNRNLVMVGKGNAIYSSTVPLVQEGSHGIDQRFFDWRDCFRSLHVKQAIIVESFYQSYACIDDMPPAKCVEHILDNYVCEVQDFFDKDIQVAHSDLHQLLIGSIYYDGFTCKADELGYLVANNLIFKKSSCFVPRFPEMEITDVKSLVNK